MRHNPDAGEGADPGQTSNKVSFLESQNLLTRQAHRVFILCSWYYYKTVHEHLTVIFHAYAQRNNWDTSSSSHSPPQAHF